MTFNDKQLEALAAPLNRDVVKQREQAGRKLSYIEAWHAIAEANRIFGYDGWNRETVELKLLGEPREVPDKYGKPQYRVGYMAKVRITVGAIIREGCGFGSGIDKDVDQAHESALKEAESDAMKRALMTFGNQFGLALYDKEQANVVDGPPPPPPPPQRLTAAEAKRQGIHTKINAEIDALDLEGVRRWFEDFDRLTETLPLAWLDPLRDRLELRREELMAGPSEQVADQIAAMDEDFRQAVGGGQSIVAGNNGHSEGAA